MTSEILDDAMWAIIGKVLFATGMFLLGYWCGMGLKVVKCEHKDGT